MTENIKNKSGFIAALDQSGGSSLKALSNYGIDIIEYKKEEIDNLTHKIRERIITNEHFKSDKIFGVILFDYELNQKMNNKNVVDYLKEKNMVTFIKIDTGLKEMNKGVKLMKKIPKLEEKLAELKKTGIFGTKQRSVIYENNEEGIKTIVKQQFDLAKIIYKHGLIPIIEPEVDINSKEKEACEITLKKEIDKELNKLTNEKIVFKLTIPTIDNLYIDYTNHKNVLKVAFLSGGYDRKTSCKLLSKNKGVVASFSRALLEDLKENQTEEEFSNRLKENIKEIYEASIK